MFKTALLYFFFFPDGWPVTEHWLPIFLIAKHNIALAKRSFGVSYFLIQDLLKEFFSI